MKIPHKIKQQKGKKKIIALTAYDYTFARLLDEAEVDIILVGDSLGMVCAGDKDTKSVTLEQMTYHTRYVARGVKNALCVADLPVNTYNTPAEGLKSSRLLIESGAQAIKVEAVGNIVPVVSALIHAGIPVMGHVGLTPQTAEKFVVQGKNEETAKEVMRIAKDLDAAGIFSLVLECIPSKLAAEITAAVTCPTLGIGAGGHCDGQILVSYDVLGLFPDFRPKFVRRFVEGGDMLKQAIAAFRGAVVSGDFPGEKESFS